MATQTDKLALKTMRALRKEQNREPSLLKCRTFDEVSDGFFSSQEECDRVISFIKSRKLIDYCTRANDDIAAHPNEKGELWIDSHKEKWTRAERFTAYGLIATVVLAAIALLYQRGQP